MPSDDEHNPSEVRRNPGEIHFGFSRLNECNRVERYAPGLTTAALTGAKTNHRVDAGGVPRPSGMLAEHPEGVP